MPRTQTPVNVNSVAWTTVRASEYCLTVTISETDQAATTDYLLAAPTTADGPRTYPAGKEAKLAGPFQRNQVVCNLKAATGSTTFDILEE